MSAPGPDVTPVDEKETGPVRRWLGHLVARARQAPQALADETRDALDEFATAPRAAASPSTSAGTKALEEAWSRSRPGTYAIVFFSLFINVLRLAVPLYIFQLLDRVLTSRSVETLIMLTIIALAAVVAGAVAESIRRRLLTGWGVWIEGHFGRRVLLLGLRQGGGLRPSQMLKDLESLRQFLASGTVPAWLDVMFVPVFLVIIFLISPVIAGIVVLALAIMLTLGTMNERLTRSSRSAATRAGQDSSEWLVSVERDAKAVGSHDISTNLANRWQRSAETRLQENMATRMVGLLTSDGMKLVEGCLRIFCYGVGVVLVLLGNLSVGGVIAAALLARLVSGAFRRAMSSWRNLVSARAAYARVKRYLAADEPAPSVTQAKGHALTLQVDDISHRYDEQPGSLFRHVSLVLKPGELLCIVGPSGSGKSTLARILSGKMAPRSGMVRYGGVDIMRLPPEEMARQLNYLPQDAHIFPGTIRENIAGVAPVSDDDIIAAASMAGIHDKIVRLPMGYETEIGDGAAALSAGERQRVALARAFLGQPSLIVLDEPEAHLDGGAIQLLNEALAACKARGAMVVVTSHSAEVASIADKAVVIKNSRGAVYGSREELREWRRQTLRSNPRIVAGTSSNEQGS